jgi:DivIVA domain-containing protein
VTVSSSAIWVSRRNLVQDCSRRYVIFIDEIRVGAVAPYLTGRYDVTPGWHRVWARLPGTGDAAMGDVLINVKPGEVRRVRTTSRLRRLPFPALVRVLGATVWAFFPRGPFRLSTDFTPHVLLRAWPPSDDDRDPPPLPRTAQVDAVGLIAAGNQNASALAKRIRNATFATQVRGYSPRDVDKTLGSLAEALEAGRPIDPAQVTGTDFPRARRGYEVESVERFLKALRENLENRS